MPRRPPAVDRPVAKLFGLTIDRLSLADTVLRVERLIDQGSVHVQIAVNVDKVVKASRDLGLREIINTSDVVNADGQPIVWASRLVGQPLPERVTGIDLMQALIARSETTGWRLYFLGAREPVIKRVVERMTREHPRAVVAGARSGFWAPADEGSVAHEVALSKPDILFLGFPSPAKEEFLHRWRNELGAKFVMGVGGSFDVYAGLIPRAPVMVQRFGLEWLFRLMQEPRRMWRRYLVDDLKFLPILAGTLMNVAWARSRSRWRLRREASSRRR